ncbi:MAG: hypothetical protein ACFE0K_15775 [Alcanivorax sp.]|uniref:hypothetical protein n=1 Tax=Alcanivorax sp. TaxID=1872427 RepID=UPI003DA717BF
MRYLLATIISLSALVLSGCFGSDNDRPPRQQAPVAINYTAFVKAQLATNGDTRDPVPINDTRFIFRDLNNPDAYDDVLAADQ